MIRQFVKDNKVEIEAINIPRRSPYSVRPQYGQAKERCCDFGKRSAQRRQAKSTLAGVHYNNIVDLASMRSTFSLFSEEACA